MSNIINSMSGIVWPQNTTTATSGSLGAGSAFQSLLSAQLSGQNAEKTYGALGSEYFNATAAAANAAYIASLVGKQVSGVQMGSGDGTRTSGVVTGIDFGAGYPVLSLNNGGKIALSDVENIAQASNAGLYGALGGATAFGNAAGYLVGALGGAPVPPGAQGVSGALGGTAALSGAQGVAGALGGAAISSSILGYSVGAMSGASAVGNASPFAYVPAELRTQVPAYTAYAPQNTQNAQDTGAATGGGSVPTFYLPFDWAQAFSSEPNLFLDGTFDSDPTWVPNEDGSFG